MASPAKSHIVPRSLLEDIAVWWPLLLVGPAVVAIRLGDPLPPIASWAWLGVGLVLSIHLIRLPGSGLATRPAMLLSGFLLWAAVTLIWSPGFERGVRLTLMMVVFLVAYLWGRVTGPPAGSSRLWLAGVGGLLVAAWSLVGLPEPDSHGGLNPDRILAMGAIALVLVSWHGPRKRWQVLATGMFGLGMTVTTGSRMASAVLTVLLVSAPRLRLAVAGRLLLGLALVVGVALVSTTSSFQERWFEEGQGNVVDLVTLQGIQTSGRAEVWSRVVARCNSPLVGEGSGAADVFANTENPAFPEPHNEFLRIWCDTGLVGSLLFWSFFGVILVSAFGRFRTRVSWADAAALQAGAAILLMSLTDNPLTTTIPFIVPMALFLGWSCPRSDSLAASPYIGLNRRFKPDP